METRRLLRCCAWLAVLLLGMIVPGPARTELTTWDGKHSIERIDVTVVYFVPRDRPSVGGRVTFP